MFVFLSYWKDFVGTEKRVRIIQDKQAIRVRAIEVILYVRRHIFSWRSPSVKERKLPETKCGRTYVWKADAHTYILRGKRNTPALSCDGYLVTILTWPSWYFNFGPKPGCSESVRFDQITVLFDQITVKLLYLLYVFRQTCLRKQCRSRSDAAVRGVWSGSALFATHPESYTHLQIVKWTCWREV